MGKCPASAEQQPAEREIADKVACLSYENARREVSRLQPKKEVQQRVENRLVFSAEAKFVTRLDEAKPQNCAIQVLQQVLLGRFSAAFPASTRRHSSVLAGDHHIVHVTLAQASPTDAHNRVLLQQV